MFSVFMIKLTFGCIHCCRDDIVNWPTNSLLQWKNWYVEAKTRLSFVWNNSHLLKCLLYTAGLHCKFLLNLNLTDFVMDLMIKHLFVGYHLQLHCCLESSFFLSTLGGSFSCAAFCIDLSNSLKFHLCEFSLKQQLIVQLPGMMCQPLEMPLKYLLRCIKKILIMYLTMSSITLFLCLYGRSYSVHLVIFYWISFISH